MTRTPKSLNELKVDATGVDSGVSDNSQRELSLTRAALESERRRRTQAEELCGELRKDSLGAREEEQRRFARDLHDHVGQTLTALKLALAAGRKAVLQTEVVAARLSEAERACEELERGLASVAARLRPAALDELGLSAALEQLIDEWRGRVSAEFDLQVLGVAQRLPHEIETVLFRIVQEALTNVARHAEASRVQVVLQRADDFVLVSIEVDGKGFDLDGVSSSHHGIAGMRERVLLLGGNIDVESWPGAGTAVVARLPIPAVSESRSLD